METQLAPTAVTADPLSYRARMIKRASERIPVTAEDLPIGFYRCDLLPFEQPSFEEQMPTEGISDEELLAQAQLREVQSLSAAFTELIYDQGFPTLASGEPFWHKLDFEPGLAYAAFQIYLDMDETGARDLSEIARNTELINILTQQRDGEAPPHSQVLSIITEYSILYYWRHRSRAHDLFKEAAYRHQRIKRAMSAEDYHYRLSEKLLKQVETYLGTEDFAKGLTPKTAMEALTRLVAIQRVSVGLPAAGPLPSKEAPESTQFEMILRQLGMQNVTSGRGQGTTGSNRMKSKALENILEDPANARQMQELIIRVTTQNFDPVDPNLRDNGPPRRHREQPSAENIQDVEFEDDVKFHKEVGG